MVAPPFLPGHRSQPQSHVSPVGPSARPPRPSVPLFRPQGANPETGLLPPRYQYASSGNFFKKSVRIKSGICSPWRWDPAPKILLAKYGWEAGPSGADFWPCVWAPILTPWFAPYRGFLAPMMTVSPLTTTFFSWVRGAILDWPHHDWYFQPSHPHIQTSPH